MISISSNHWSVDDQVSDAMSHLGSHHIKEYSSLIERYPEWGALTWSGSWVDAEASGVDVEYMSWLCDDIEATGVVMWEDGEPYCHECD